MYSNASSKYLAHNHMDRKTILQSHFSHDRFRYWNKRSSAQNMFQFHLWEGTIKLQRCLHELTKACLLLTFLFHFPAGCSIALAYFRVLQWVSITVWPLDWIAHNTFKTLTWNAQQEMAVRFTDLYMYRNIFYSMYHCEQVQNVSDSECMCQYNTCAWDWK